MLSVNTNYSAMVALQNLNFTNTELEGVQNKISTGLKISSARDNGAIYAIAEGQRSRVSSVAAVKDGIDRANSTIDVALAAGKSIGDILQKLKAKAVAAQADDLTADQRDALQEIANIGMGQAGSSIAKIWGEFVRLSIPRVANVERQDIPTVLQQLVGEKNIQIAPRVMVSGDKGTVLRWEVTGARSPVRCATWSRRGPSGGTCYDRLVSPGKETPAGDLGLRVDEDIISVAPFGDLPVEQAHRVVQLASQVLSRHGHLFLLADMKRAGLVPAESRRILVRFAAEHTPLALAMYNVGPLVRGVNALLFGAIGLLGKRRLNVMQFATEEAARQWLLAERRRLLSDRGQG